MKNKIYTITAIVIVMIIIIVVIVFRNTVEGWFTRAVTPAEKTAPKTTNNTTATTTTTAAQGALNYDLALGLGSSGPEVKQLQDWLGNLVGGISVDGIFGSETLTALQNAYSAYFFKDLYNNQTTLREFSTYAAQAGENVGTVNTKADISSTDNNGFMSKVENYFGFYI